MKVNVKQHQLRVITSIGEGQRVLSDHQAMQYIRERMYLFDPLDLADSVGVSRSCIYSIRSGRTKWPRGTTLFRMLDVLDLELWIRVREK
jgi:hypothetical protein